MVDSRNKGRTAENKAKELLKSATGLPWERTPLSGALHEKHKLKGDLYVPGKDIKFCVEVKHYKDDHLTSKVISGKNPIFLSWWDQTVREANQIDKMPFLIFKFDRSKWFVAMYHFHIDLGVAFQIYNDADFICEAALFDSLQSHFKTKTDFARWFTDGEGL